MTLFQIDFFVFMLILLLVGGGVCIVVAAFVHSRSNAAGFVGQNTTADQADEALSELDDMSKTVFKEFDNKYQELLFLYSLVDEKQKSLEGAQQVPSGPHNQARGLAEYAGRVDIVIDDSKKTDINPKFASILRMHREGQSAEEIARKLDMGKGEVSLIITLGRGQNG